MRKTLLTAGITELDRSKFDTEGNIMMNKPFFGLYASSLMNRKDKRGIWSDWMEYVETSYYLKKYKEGITYKLNPNAKIYTINTLDDYKNLLKKYSMKSQDNVFHVVYDNSNEICIDWNKFKEDYDVFHLSYKGFFCLRHFGMYQPDDIKFNDNDISDFSAYNCETWIIFNFDAIDLSSVQTVDIQLENEEED